jgi:hypothetical protein
MFLACIILQRFLHITKGSRPSHSTRACMHQPIHSRVYLAGAHVLQFPCAKKSCKFSFPADICPCGMLARSHWSRAHGCIFSKHACTFWRGCRRTSYHLHLIFTKTQRMPGAELHCCHGQGLLLLLSCDVSGPFLRGRVDLHMFASAADSRQTDISE